MQVLRTIAAVIISAILVVPLMAIILFTDEHNFLSERVSK